MIATIDAAIDRHLDQTGISLERLPGSETVRFGRKKKALVYVYADEAIQIHGGRRIPGDFLADGEHWNQLRSLLLEVQGVVEAPVLATDFLHSMTSFPSSLPPELAAMALPASARIRADLCVFPCPVLLEGEAVHIRFEPMRRSPSLLVPFSVRRADGRETTAALDFSNSQEPIPVVFEDQDHEPEIAEAWAVALLAFADLVGTFAPANSEATLPHAPQRKAQPEKPQETDTPRRLPRRVAGSDRSASSSSALKPMGETAKHQGSFVVGHRRHLPPGQACREHARDAARIYGVDLAPGWTWVQPHKRGIPSGVLLSYSWQMPSQIIRVWRLAGVPSAHAT